jgi:probable RNA-binding protein EIF1AD
VPEYLCTLNRHQKIADMGRPKRHLHAAAQESVTPPSSLGADQFIARVLKAEGNNLYHCQIPSDLPKPDPSPETDCTDSAEVRDTKPTTVLVELAARFRNTIWIKRGGYVLVELTPDDERPAGSKVDGEIVNVVRDEREWRKMEYW